MKKFFAILFLIGILFPTVNAQSHWSFEVHSGQAFNLPMPLTIRQDGYPDIKLLARYSSESFILPIYWDVRLARWQNKRAWELEVIHHKLYLKNTTSEVQKFNISHGFNLIMVNRGFEKKSIRYRAGVGIVLAHPESKIMGKEYGSSVIDLDMGYYISGPVINIAISRPFYIGSRFYVNAEAKTTLSYSSINVVQGNSDVYNIAFHLILGLGADLLKSVND